jgi:hypothetical protein
MPKLSRGHLIYKSEQKQQHIENNILLLDLFFFITMPLDDKFAFLVMCHLVNCNLVSLFLEHLLVVGCCYLIGCHDLKMAHHLCFHIKLINPTNLAYSQS